MKPLAVDDLVLDPRGGLYVPATGTLAVADVHVGFEAALARRGMPLPAHEGDELAGMLFGMLDTHAPERLVVCGDFTHGTTRRDRAERAVAADLWRRLTSRVPVVMVAGNHDAELRTELPEAGFVAAHREGKTVYAHGHEAVAGLAATDTLVAGHEHPVIGVPDELGLRVRARAFLLAAATPDTPRLLILPALAPWARGVDVLNGAGFMGPDAARVDPGAMRTFALADDAVLPFGTVAQLRALSAR